MNEKIVGFIVCILLFFPVFSAAGVINQNLDDMIILDKVRNINPKALTNDDNNPPNPPMITGSSSGRVRKSYEYNITLTDPDEDDYMFYLEVDFGDGVTHYCGTGCGNPWPNGTVVKVSHRWKKTGDYGITARVQDEPGEWSNWSDPFVVTMPKNKMTTNSLFFSFLQQHPNLFPILQTLLLHLGLQ